jgi:hypothetical protein
VFPDAQQRREKITNLTTSTLIKLLVRRKHVTVDASTFFPQRARELVFEHVKTRLEPTDQHVNFDLCDVYVVSFTFVVGSWKTLVSTTLPDGMYYEVTYNSQKKETYITSYKRWGNVIIPDEEQL